MKHRKTSNGRNYHYNAHRLQSVNGQDEVPVVYHYDNYGRVDTLYDESGLVCYTYGNMGEITRETRIYTLPFLANIIALNTQFEYDSWGRILNITYPDNEIVSYEYDCGGQLFKFYNNQNYTYLDSVQYNKFGAKISQKYGNGIQTKYTYYPLTQRLDSLLTTYGGNTLSYLQYTYDSVGNIIRVNSSYPMPQYVVTERYSYDSADQLLTAESTCNNNLLCSGAYSYNNWGKINTFTQQTTDPATNTSENKDYRYYFPSNSSDMAQGQTSFAPIIKYDMQQNTQPLETCTYGINGSIRKRYDHPTQNTDYYYFNASGNLKACGTDMQISLYGYNASNTRTYKVNLFNANQWVNGQPQPIQPMVQSAMFYPNTYINFTQAGEYTKHYYNGTERIASRLGEQQVPISVENDQELEAYRNDVKQIIYNAIGQHLYDEPTDMQEGDVIPLEFLQPCGNSNAVYYYHPNHLASTMYVTDVQQSVVQSFLYAPYGEIISEYNTHAMGDAFPKYAFNAKELDEETGMYYYEARYYAPPTFISRDPLMSEKTWLSPYHYCSNNPVGRVDPSGMSDGWIQDEQGNVFWDNNTNSIEEFKQNYSGKDGYSYVSDADNPKSYTLPSREGRLVMNEWFALNDIHGFEGVGGVNINISFIANDKNAEIGWVQTYTSNITVINDGNIHTMLPEANSREYLDGGPFGQTCNPENSTYFDNPPKDNLCDAPIIARNEGAQYDPLFKAQSTILLNGKRVLSVGWGYIINSRTSQTIFAPKILHSTTSFHNSAVNNVIKKVLSK